MKLFTILFFVAMLFVSCNSKEKKAASTPAQTIKKTTAYIGTYTRKEGHVDGKAAGIYRIKIDQQTGKISNKTTVAQLINPSYIAITKDKKHLYAVSELAQAGETTGYVYAFKITPDSLQEINRLPTNGLAPCHVEIDKTGNFVFVANYVGGIAKMYRRGAGGELIATDEIQLEGSSVHPQQDSPHLHSVKISPDNQWAIIPDKGTDNIWIFKIDHQEGKLIPHTQAFIKIQAGAGPRHAVWSADGQFIYVINELDNSMNVLAYKDTDQSFQSIQNISTLPDNFKENSYCADIHLHPSGSFLYGSNRGHNSIVIYKVDKETGKLSNVGFESTRGDFPRNFNLAKNGQWLYAANQNTSNITVYKIDPTTGLLTFTEEDFDIETPVCIAF